MTGQASTKNCVNTSTNPTRPASRPSRFIEGLPGFIPGSIINPILDLLNNPNVVNFNLSATWNEGASCLNSCREARYTTAQLNVTSLSECQKYGRCLRPDGTIEHDVTEADCEGTPSAQCVAQLPRENAGMGTLYIGDQSQTRNTCSAPRACTDRAMARLCDGSGQRGSGVRYPSMRQKCNNEGYCLNFTHMPSDTSAAEGYVSLGAWAQADFALSQSALLERRQVNLNCPNGC